MLVDQKIAPRTLSRSPKPRPHDLNGALTSTSWLPNADMAPTDWVEHGRRLGVIGRGVGWWIGDWLRYGNMKWGERYVRASRITGYDVQTLMNMVYVATAYEPSQRRRNLSFSHHAELAALPPEARDRWLDMAEANRLSVRCLREELRRERRLEAGEAEAHAGEQEVLPPATEPTETAEPHHGLLCPQCGCKLAEQAAAGFPR